MEMSITILEVDLTIRNPIVLSALIIWCLPVALLGWAAGQASARRSSHLTGRVILLLVLTLASPVAIRFLACWMYVLPRRELVSVGLWGAPPMITPAAVALAFAASSYVFARRRTHASANA